MPLQLCVFRTKDAYCGPRRILLRKSGQVTLPSEGDMWSAICENMRMDPHRSLRHRGSPVKGLISSPTLAQVKERTIRNLGSAPFYAGLLKRSFIGHLRRYSSPGDALRSRLILQLYLQPELWVQKEKRLEAIGQRILNPERAFQRYKKRKSSLSPVTMSREFDQAILDGFANIDSVIFALRELAVDNVQLLPNPQGRPGPDAEGSVGGLTFPIEAKRLRGNEGFYKLQAEIDRRRAIDPHHLAELSVSVRSPFATSHGGLELLSDEDLAVIGERFYHTGRRREPGPTIVDRVIVSGGHEITLELNDGFGPGHLNVMGTAGLLDPLDTSSLEAKVAGKVREAAAQLSAWYEDGVNRPSDLAFIQVEFPGHMIFFSDEAESRVIQIAADAGQQAGIRVKVSCTWS